jgi:nitrite reductase/ring-hydroxylating ferredoxin subunit
MKASTVHVLPRRELPENGVATFDVAGTRYLVVDVDGDVRAYAVIGPAAASADRAVVAEGRLRCPLHGWPIEPVEGTCGAAELCRYRPLAVQASADEIRVTLAAG